ncbi:MAG: hypothetical protein KAY37_07150 [Phycisphaerae bacterium]|nr:hypothetical protein [Phycisphaerae bacterium]
MPHNLVPHNNVAAGLRTDRTTGWKPVPHENVAAGLRTDRPTGWKPVPHNKVAAGCVWHRHLAGGIITGWKPVPHNAGATQSGATQ